MVKVLPTFLSFFYVWCFVFFNYSYNYRIGNSSVIIKRMIIVRIRIIILKSKIKGKKMKEEKQNKENSNK